MNEVIDPIIVEVRKAREAYAEKFNLDIRAMGRDLKERQSSGAHRVISLPPKKIIEKKSPAL